MMERSDGISAMFGSRREADLAVEHLVQEHGIERDVIFVQAAGETGTTGTRVVGADASSGGTTTRERTDAPLNGEIKLTVAVTENDHSAVDRVLREAGAHQIRSLP